MKNWIAIFFAFFTFSLLAQTTERVPIVEKNLTQTTSTVSLNDLETFKNQFEEWNVGNLHFYSQKQNENKKDYYFHGKKISPIFQQHVGKILKRSLVESGKEPHAVALVRGKGLDDYYVLRINDGKSNNVLVLYEFQNEQLTPKKTLAYFYKKNGRTYQLDSWMQDVNGDTQLDLIQRKRITKADGTIRKDKTKVLLQKKKGKFKYSRRTKIEQSNYQLEVIE